MAVAFIQEFPIEGDDRSTTNYDTIAARLDAQSNPPEGGILHTAGWDEDAGVFRIFDVWESQEHAERFISERLMPVVNDVLGDQGAALAPARQYFYELHDVAMG